jgi:hypothetical protein
MDVAGQGDSGRCRSESAAAAAADIGANDEGVMRKCKDDYLAAAKDRRSVTAKYNDDAWLQG